MCHSANHRSESKNLKMYLLSRSTLAIIIFTYEILVPGFALKVPQTDVTAAEIIFSNFLLSYLQALPEFITTFLHLIPSSPRGVFAESL